MGDQQCRFVNTSRVVDANGLRPLWVSEFETAFVGPWPFNVGIKLGYWMRDEQPVAFIVVCQ